MIINPPTNNIIIIRDIQDTLLFIIIIDLPEIVERIIPKMIIIGKFEKIKIVIEISKVKIIIDILTMP